jgi:hypothetical protein
LAEQWSQSFSDGLPYLDDVIEKEKKKAEWLNLDAFGGAGLKWWSRYIIERKVPSG